MGRPVSHPQALGKERNSALQSQRAKTMPAKFAELQSSVCSYYGFPTENGAQMCEDKNESSDTCFGNNPLLSKTVVTVLPFRQS